MRRRFWFGILGVSLSLSAWAVATLRPPVKYENFLQRESQMSRALTRGAQFVAVPHVTLSQSCAEIQPPQALTTPDPFLTPIERNPRVKISFIIGTDGRVHSPLILESAGFARDRNVLQIVRTWKYRPATCNGVPTEIEGKVEFSSE